MTPAEIAAACAGDDEAARERVRRWVRGALPWWARPLPGTFKSDMRSRRFRPSDMPVLWLWRSLAFSLVRWAVVPDLDPNENFNCGFCSKPLLRRYLYCSQKCDDAQELAWQEERAHADEDQ